MSREILDSPKIREAGPELLEALRKIMWWGGVTKQHPDGSREIVVDYNSILDAEDLFDRLLPPKFARGGGK